MHPSMSRLKKLLKIKKEIPKIERTFRVSSLSKELETGATDESENKNGLDLLNQVLAIDMASLTSSNEGRITPISSEALNYQVKMLKLPRTKE